MNLCAVLVLVLMLTEISAHSTIIPSSRVAPWGTNTVGVPGGIPTRTNLSATLSPGATVAQINSAIAACPSNSVVYLSAGTYTLSGSINFASHVGVTLRGAGPKQTILNFTSGGFGTDQYGNGGSTAISSGYTQGSSNLVVASTALFTLGDGVTISESDEPGLVYADGGAGAHFKWHAIVTAINSGTSTITIWPPMFYTLQSGLSPTATYHQVGCRWCGVEDMTIISNPNIGDAMWMDSCYACWFKNLEGTNFATDCLFLTQSTQCEVRHCYFHWSNSGQDGIGVYLGLGSAGILVEDNIGADLFTCVDQYGGVGNVFLYNFMTNGITHQGFSYQLGSVGCNHGGGQSAFCLFEGNVGEQFQNDGYHTSCSHITLLRNWFHGLHPSYTGNRKMVDLCRFSYYHNVVGNVLGWTWTNSSTVYEMTGIPDYVSEPCIYRLGYPNMGDNNPTTPGSPVAAYTNGYPDTNVSYTLLRHGNYDFKTASIVWDGTISDHNIPNSYFYASKPAYFGILNWPPYDPASPLSSSPTNIPAGYRYIYGVDPPTNTISSARSPKKFGGKIIFGNGQF